MPSFSTTPTNWPIAMWAFKDREDGVVSVSDMSDFLCSIHVDISEGAAPGTVVGVEQPYAPLGGRLFILERSVGPPRSGIGPLNARRRVWCQLH